MTSSSVRYGETIALTTRVPVNDLPEFFAWIQQINHPAIAKIYVVSDASDAQFAQANIYNANCQNIYDPNPTRPTAYNLVIDELNKTTETQHHLLAVSREVQMQDTHIQTMLSYLSSPKCIVAGYSLRDNVLTEQERLEFIGAPPGVAYIVPWSTCALWNREFVYGKGGRRLRFDPLCDGKNDLGNIIVTVNDEPHKTVYAGMEDGLAIARLIQQDSSLWYTLLSPELPWYFKNDEHRRLKHKIKMARKNMVLEKYLEISGLGAGILQKAKR